MFNLNTCSLTHINNFKLNPNWLRVGILPFYNLKNIIYLLLGIYKVSNNHFELCALSGGYKRTTESILDGAFREFNEETEQLFQEYEFQIKNDIIKSPIIYSYGKNGIDRILFLFNISKYIELLSQKYNINNISINLLKSLFTEHFKQKKNTELYGIQFININKFVYNYSDIKIYTDLIYFMKKNNIYRNKNLEKFIKYNNL